MVDIIGSIALPSIQGYNI